jgi:undecaprenyl-diphosphatase
MIGSNASRTIAARLSPHPRREQFFRQPRTALISGAALIALVVLIGLVIPTGPLAIDQRWSEWLSDSSSNALHHLALVFNYLGRGLGRALSLTAIGLTLLLARRWRALLAFAATESLTPLLGNLLKHLVDRPRPPNAMLHANGSSFPSGHAAYAGATTVALVLLFTLPGRRLRYWLLAALVTAGMAWSRTQLQVHWLSDAISGALLGVGVALVCFAGAQLIRAEPVERNELEPRETNDLDPDKPKAEPPSRAAWSKKNCVPLLAMLPPTTRGTRICVTRSPHAASTLPANAAVPGDRPWRVRGRH